MERIKVIEYISNLGDGGAETLVKDYVRLIDRERFEPVIVILNGGGASANRRILEESQIPIIELLPQWNICVRIWKKLFGWWYIPHRLRKILREENAHVLHMHLIVLKDVPRIGKDLKGVRLFFTCHNVPEVVFSKDLKVERKAAEQLIRNENMQLIALHSEMAQQLNEMFDVDNTIVMWNGIDVKRFRDNGITATDEKHKLGISKDAFVIGHVGRFAEQKNHNFLVDIFAEVAKIRTDAFLLMVGAGDTSLVEEKLREKGLDGRYMILSKRSDVNEIMRAMDVFVFPSKFEGLPLVLVEAQYSGLRCVVSDKITKEVICTDHVIMLPLVNPTRWAEVIIDQTLKGKAYTPIDVFDMNAVMNRLEMLYSGDLR